MKFQKKVLALTGMLVLGAGACVAANALNEEIVALKSYEVNIKYNGEIQTMYDANGKQVFPIMYEGTTYVPVRAVSNIFGVAVDWDGETQTVLLGENDEWRKITVEDIQYSKSKWFPGTLNLEHEGVKYDSGYKSEREDGRNLAFPAMELKLDNKSTQLSFKVISEAPVKDGEVDLKVTVKDLDSKATIYEGKMKSNSDLDVLLNVAGYNRLSIYVEDLYTGIWYEGVSKTYLVDVKTK